MNKKVVLLQEYAPEYRIPFFSRLIELANDESIDVSIAAGEPNSTQAQRGDHWITDFIHPLPQREYKFLNRRIVVRRSAELITNADLVVTEQARRNLDAYRLLAWKKRGRQVAMWGHGRDYVLTPSRPEQFITRRLTNRADWFFAYTDQGKAAVQGMGFDSARITVVQNSIDTTKLRSDFEQLAPSQIIEFERRYDLRGKTALFLGGLDSSKRLDFLLESAQVIHAKEPDFRLLVVGVGNQKELIQEFASQNSWIKYLGPLFGTEKALAMRASDILVMPGRVGLIAVDSFATGIPIVTTNWPWHAPEFEYLVNGGNSVISNDTVEMYANSALRLLNDAELRRKLSEQCQRDSGRYTIDEMARRFLGGIRGVLS